jgi:hypothetical protein
MDVSEILRFVFIAGLVLIALPFPIILAAAATAFAVAGFIAIQTLLGFRKDAGVGPDGRPRVSSSRSRSTSPFT